jgi:Fe-S-cluster-containing dehydrogenase component
MKKWNLLIDVAKCFNCNCCTLACHDEYHDNEHPGVAAGMPKHGQNWFRIEQRETGAVPMVEAMAALVLADHALRHRAQCGSLSRGTGPRLRSRARRPPR